MNAYIVNDKTLIFWTPKCACTSLLNIINQINGTKHERYAKGLFKRVELNNVNLVANYKKIFLMRNPYHRLLSAFINKFIYHPQIGFLDTFTKLEGFSQNLIIREKHNFFENNMYNGITFNEFVDLISKYYNINDHWNYQKKFNMTFDYIVHVENLEEELKNVFRELGISTDFMIPCENKSTYIDNCIDIDLSDVKSVDIIKNHMNDIKKTNFLNTSNKEKIYKTYRTDFLTGNYDP